MSLLQRILLRGLALDSLAFLEGNEPNLLIDSFAIFYAARIAMFSRSTHILDVEETVRKRLNAMQLTQDGLPATHFRFADSTTEPGIQLSDIVVGLLAKMHTFLTRTPIGEKEAGSRAHQHSATRFSSTPLLNLGLDFVPTDEHGSRQAAVSEFFRVLSHIRSEHRKFVNDE